MTYRCPAAHDEVVPVRVELVSEPDLEFGREQAKTEERVLQFQSKLREYIYQQQVIQKALYQRIKQLEVENE